MKILNKIEEVRSVRKEIRDKITGLIHLSGNIHPGSVQVVRKLCTMCEVRFATIFLNPFIENFHKIKNVCENCLESDFSLLEEENVDYLFCPDVKEIFPEDDLTSVYPEKIIEKFSPFKSEKYIVSTATLYFKLLNLFQPDFVFIGQKSFLELFILKQIVKDFDMDVSVVVSPTLRNEEGIPFSSEIKTLDESERKISSEIYSVLSSVRNAFSSGERNSSKLLNLLKEGLSKIEGFNLIKAEILSLKDLSELENIEGESVLVLLGEVDGKKYTDALFLKSKI